MQIAEIDATVATTPYVTKTYRWDPSEPVATRPVALSLWTREGTVRETFYYTHDLRKNVVSLFDALGMRRASYQYDPYGNITSMEGDMAESNPYRFSSEHHDEDLGLVYYNYRHYNPTVGRWTSRDPIAEQGGWNLYGFVGNRPINVVDIYGLKIYIRETVYEHINGSFVLYKYQSVKEKEQYEREFAIYAIKIQEELNKLLGENCGKLIARGSNAQPGRRHYTLLLENNPNSKDCVNHSICETLKKMIESDTVYNIFRLPNHETNAWVPPGSTSTFIGTNASSERHVITGYDPLTKMPILHPEKVPVPYDIILWHEFAGHAYDDLDESKKDTRGHLAKLHNYKKYWFLQILESLKKNEDAKALYGPCGTKMDNAMVRTNEALEAHRRNGLPLPLPGTEWWFAPFYYDTEPTARDLEYMRNIKKHLGK